MNVNFNGPGSIVTQVKLDVSLYDIKTTCTTGNVDWELFDIATRIAEDKSTDNPNIYKKLNCTVEKTFNLKITSTGSTKKTYATNC